MANLLFGYRLLEADKSAVVSGNMLASTFGSSTDQTRKYYLQLYAYRNDASDSGNLNLDGFEVEMTFNDTILASLNAAMDAADGSYERSNNIDINSAFPIFRDFSFGNVGDAGAGLNTVRFAAGSAKDITAGGAYASTGTGLEFDYNDNKVLATIELDIKDDWSTNRNVSAPTPAIGTLVSDGSGGWVESGDGIKVNIDETVVRASAGDVQSIRQLRGETGASLQTFDATVTTGIARASQYLTAKDSSNAEEDDAFAKQIGTLRDVGITGSHMTNLVREGTVFTDSAILVNTGQSTLTSVNAVKTGTVLEGEISLEIKQRDSVGGSYLNSGVYSSGPVVIAHAIANGTDTALSNVNHAYNTSGGVSAEGVIEVNRTLTVTGDAGDVLYLNDAGGLNINAYYDGANTQGLIKHIQGTTSKNLITYKADLNYDGRVSMKDLAFLNTGAAAWNGVANHSSVNKEVDANHDGSFNVADLAVLDAQWGLSLHTQPGTAVKDGDDTTDILRAYTGNASSTGSTSTQSISWAELGSNGANPNNSNAAYSWTNTSFDTQSEVEAISGFQSTL
jgi:hypothetical protein